MKKQSIPKNSLVPLFEDSSTQDTFTWKTHKNLGYPPRFHSAMELYFINSGQMKAYVNGIAYIVKEGEILVINPLEIHKYEKTGEADVSVFIFDDSYLHDFKKEYENKVFPTHLKDTSYNKKIYNVLSDIEPSYKDNVKLSKLAKIAYVNSVLDKIIIRYGLKEQPELKNELLTMIMYIYKNYSSKITLESLSKKFHYSKQTISRLMSKHLKTDLRKFVNDIRAEQVNNCLNDIKYKNTAITEIAFSCGFDSMATFYRAYKRRFSAPPQRPKI